MMAPPSLDRRWHWWLKMAQQPPPSKNNATHQQLFLLQCKMQKKRAKLQEQQNQSSCPQRFVFLLDFLEDIHCLSHGRVDHNERVFCEFRITVVKAKMILLFCFVFTKTDKITSRNAAKAFLALFTSFFSVQFLFIFKRCL